MLPPANLGGPIRIIMPPPFAPHDDPNSNFPIDPKMVRATFPGDAPLIVSDDGETRYVRVKERGKYALVDREGHVDNSFQLDPGNVLGFSVTGNNVRAVTAVSGSQLSSEDRPYQWRLYSKQ